MFKCCPILKVQAARKFCLILESRLHVNRQIHSRERAAHKVSAVRGKQSQDTTSALKKLTTNYRVKNNMKKAKENKHLSVKKGFLK